MSIHQLISAAAAHRGASIDAPHRSLMEDCFQSSFHDVRLHFSPASQAANDALGSLAFAIDGHIFFRPGFDASLGTPFTYLLAHELTHVVQKRGGRESARNLQSIASEKQLEQEAGAIAAGVLKGIRAPQVTPDPSSSPRLYGPAGHYWTAFYTSLAAGFDFKTANAIAFYTQLPDLVKELDAIPAGTGWSLQLGEGVLLRVELGFSYLSFDGYTKDFWRRAADHKVDEMVGDWQVQAGLHALTGGDAEDETRHRTKILIGCTPGTLEFGLAVHAFGDSFAHRDFHFEDKMYGPPFGHLAEGANQMLRLDWPDPHAPDEIVLRQPLYLRYGSALYGILSQKSPNKALVDLDHYQTALKEVARLKNDIAQAEALLEKMHAICTFDPVYDPPDESVAWNEFRNQPQHLALPPDTVTKALKCAADWCGSAEPFKISVHADLHPIESIENTVLTVTGANLTPMQFINQLYGGMPYR